VHTGSEADAVGVAETRLGAGAAWEPLTLDALRAHPATRLSGATVEVCEGDRAPLPADLTDDLKSAVVYGELQRVEQLLPELRGAVLCAEPRPEGLPLAALAELEYLGGVAAALGSDEDLAVERFRAALAVQPDLTWDDNFPTTHAALLEQARSTGDLAELSVVPEGARIDGGEATTVRAGVPHWVTHDHGSPVRLQLDFDDTLILPGALPETAITWVEDDARRRGLSQVLSVAVGEGEPVVVVHDGTAWEGITGRTDWTPHRPPTPEPLPEVAPTSTVETTRPRRGSPALIAVGAGLAAAGGGLVAEGYLTTAAAARAAEGATSSRDYDAQWERYSGGQTRAKVGYGAVGAGVVALGLGLTLNLGGPR
jgi:hypothetical protein